MKRHIFTSYRRDNFLLRYVLRGSWSIGDIVFLAIVIGGLVSWFLV